MTEETSPLIGDERSVQNQLFVSNQYYKDLFSGLLKATRDLANDQAFLDLLKNSPEDNEFFKDGFLALEQAQAVIKTNLGLK